MALNLSLAFEDVLLVPQFSTVKSRADVNLNTDIAGDHLGIPILSSNMDSVTSNNMATAMFNEGGRGILHRFWSIEDNVKAYKASPKDTWCCFGIGKDEFTRAVNLYNAGCGWLVLDVAHGAAQHVVDQAKKVIDSFPDVNLIVGNFANAKGINDFNYQLGTNVAAYKCNIGSGSACTTRVVTGCGLPSFSSLQSCVSTGFDIIQDGGIRNSGDLAKAMAVGAKAVILGRLLAGCDESSGELLYVDPENNIYNQKPNDYYVTLTNMVIKEVKRYRGSASQESYEVQGKVAEYRSAEGDAFLVPYRGSVKEVLQELSAGLRSSMSYVGAHNLKEFRERAEFVQVTQSGQTESGSHGKQ